MKSKTVSGKSWLLVGLAALVCSPAYAKDDFPQTTDDGLTRIDSKNVDVVYWKDGATLAQYKRLAMLDCYVAFRKNWERDFNRDAVGLDGRVSTKDMERIKTGLAEEFTKVFTKELSDKGGYTFTDEAADDVLILRPAIVNLDVNAPDLRTASRVDSFVTSAGEMTLYLELFDAATGDIIGRVIDQREDRDSGFGQRANRVTNKADADRIIRGWAETLRKALDNAHEVGK